MGKTISRFAPSPTGLLHVGNARIALINWLYTRKNNGKFILRIDDTDSERSSEMYEKQIKQDLEWLGLHWDETFNQRDRAEFYNIAKDFLVKSGRLYPCYETPEELELMKNIQRKNNLPLIYDRSSLKLSTRERDELKKSGRKEHWRFLLNDEEITWEDKIKGKTSFLAKNLNDPILFKSDGSMTYTLSSVVDDIYCEITDIIRGEDHLTNTAVHIQLFEALSAKNIPSFSHLSLLYNKNSEISKRLGGFSIGNLREENIESIAVNSFLAKIGTSDNVTCEKNMDDLIKQFDLGKFSKSSVHYDKSDIEMLNSKIIKSFSYEEVAERLNPKITEDFWLAIKQNIMKVEEANEWWSVCNGTVDPIINSRESQEICSALASYIEESEKGEVGHTGQISIPDIVKKIQSELNIKSKKDIFSAIRLAMTGRDYGPEIKNILSFISKEKLKMRLRGKAA